MLSTFESNDYANFPPTTLELADRFHDRTEHFLAVDNDR